MILGTIRAFVGRLANLITMAGFAGVVRIIPVDRSANEIADALRKLSEGGWMPIHWAGFITQPVSDPVLESIRARAVAIELPLTDNSQTIIFELLDELESLDGVEI